MKEKQCEWSTNPGIGKNFPPEYIRFSLQLYHMKEHSKATFNLAEFSVVHAAFNISFWFTSRIWRSKVRKFSGTQKEEQGWFFLNFPISQNSIYTITIRQQYL